jgi:hypothetical protein
VLGAAATAILAASAASSYGDSEPLCPNNVCTQEGMSARDDAFTKAGAANVVAVASGVLIAGGVVLWLVAPSTEPSAPSADVALAPAVAPGQAGAALRGAW